MTDARFITDEVLPNVGFLVDGLEQGIARAHALDDALVADSLMWCSTALMLCMHTLESIADNRALEGIARATDDDGGYL